MLTPRTVHSRGGGGFWAVGGGGGGGEVRRSVSRSHDGGTYDWPPVSMVARVAST